MATNKLLKGYRYFMKFSNTTQEPVNGQLKLLKKRPKDGGLWRDVTDALKICCTASILTAENATQAISANFTGSVITIMNADSSTGDTITVTAYSHVIDDITVDIATDGDITVTGTSGDVSDMVIPVTFTDQHTNSVTVLLTLEVNYP